MFFVSVGALGVALGHSCRWFALPVFGAILALALGVEAALHGSTFDAVALSAVLMLAILEAAYFVGALSRDINVHGWLHRKI